MLFSYAFFVPYLLIIMMEIWASEPSSTRSAVDGIYHKLIHAGKFGRPKYRFVACASYRSRRRRNVNCVVALILFEFDIMPVVDHCG